jgi:hypothetical protein
MTKGYKIDKKAIDHNPSLYFKSLGIIFLINIMLIGFFGKFSHHVELINQPIKSLYVIGSAFFILYIESFLLDFFIEFYYGDLPEIKSAFQSINENNYQTEQKKEKPKLKLIHGSK